MKSAVSPMSEAEFSLDGLSGSFATAFFGCQSMTHGVEFSCEKFPWQQVPTGVGMGDLISPCHCSSFPLESFSLPVAYVSAYCDKYQPRLRAGCQEV